VKTTLALILLGVALATLLLVLMFRKQPPDLQEKGRSTAASQQPAFPLLDFASPGDAIEIVPKGAQYQIVASETGAASMEVTPGYESEWPGIGLLRRGGWDLSSFGRIEIPLTSTSDLPVLVKCRIDSASGGGAPADTVSSNFEILLEGRAQGVMQIPLWPVPQGAENPKNKFPGMHGIPFYQSEPINAANIKEIVIWTRRSEEKVQYRMQAPIAVGEPLPDPVPSDVFPLVDRFGQFKHSDWPGKIVESEDLVSNRKKEEVELAKYPMPPDWNIYGGWKQGPQFESTGFFRTIKHDGKWYLLDPGGQLFFSIGMNAVRFTDATILNDREHWFEALPGDQKFYGEFTPNFTGREYAYDKVQCRTVNLALLNASLKYGSDWQKEFIDRALQRLASWGINTVGAWSAYAIYDLRQTPYTFAFSIQSPTIEGTSGFWGKFADVFHPDWIPNIEKTVRQDPFPSTANDPLCIGYFVDNELSWKDELSIGLGALTSPSTQPAKREFVNLLMGKYGTVAELNATWKSNYKSWDDLLERREAPGADGAAVDLRLFYKVFAERYFQTIRDVLRAAAPNHLYLGCRFSEYSANETAVKIAAKYCDVVSINIYTASPRARETMISWAGDKPVIIGEFHFGALDRGLFHPGLVPVASQKERANAYRRYVTDCLKSPVIVGCHWFMYQDEPLTGRIYDGENYQIGFVDIADTPYQETVEASRAVAADMYDVRASAGEAR
jgi:hypothetical protein